MIVNKVTETLRQNEGESLNLLLNITQLYEMPLIPHPRSYPKDTRFQTDGYVEIPSPQSRVARCSRETNPDAPLVLVLYKPSIPEELMLGPEKPGAAPGKRTG